jgi:hypothetical protein
MGMQPATRAKLREGLNSNEVRTQIAPETLARADVKFVEAKVPVEEVLNNPSVATDAPVMPNRADQDRVTRMAKADISTARHFEKAVAGGTSNDVTKALAKTVNSRNDVTNLREQIRLETKDVDKRANMKAGLAAVQKAVRAELKNASGKAKDRLEQVDDEIDVSMTMV